jgi:ABC-2 type transport system permease protein
VHPTALVAIPILTICVTYAGFGFALAGLALVYKRIEVAVMPFHLILVFVFSYGATDAALASVPGALLHAVPGLASVAQMKALLLDRGAVAWTDFLVPFTLGCAYLGLGIALFSRMLAKAQRLGRLGQY